MSISLEDMEKVVAKIDTHIGRQILKNLKANPDKPSQINITTCETETQGSFLKRSIRVAQALSSRGIGVGNILMLCGSNHLDVGVPLASCMYIGTTVMTLSPEMKILELKQMLKLGNPNIIFCDSEIAGQFAKGTSELNMSPEIVVFGELPEGKFTPFEDFLKPTGTEDKFEVTLFDPTTTEAFIILSSGTTGASKGVCLTHQNIAVPFLVPLTLPGYKKLFDASIMSFSSLVWISGVFTCLFSNLFGMTKIQSHLPFSPELAFEAISKYKANIVMLSPTGIASVLRHPKISECDFSSVKLFACGGSSITHERIEELQKYITNGVVTNSYGMTECAASVCQSMIYKKNSCGKPMPWIQLKVIDTETKEELGANKVGELYIKSPWTTFKRYHKDPEATAAAFDGDWYKTGDLVYYDDEKYFFVVNRTKEMIKFRNIQIAPMELEKEIAKIPGVYAACIVGVPHPDDGEHPGAFVQLIPGSTVSEKDIHQVIDENFSDHKKLRAGIRFLEKFPETHSGKISRKILNEMKLTLF